MNSPVADGAGSSVGAFAVPLAVDVVESGVRTDAQWAELV